MQRSSFRCFAVCCLFAALSAVIVSADEDGLNGPTCAQYFYKEKDCPNCILFTKILDDLEEDYAPNLTVQRYVVGDDDDENATLLDAFFD